MQLLEENGKLKDIGLCNDFLDLTPNLQAGKVDPTRLIKTKHLLREDIILA